MDFYIWSRPVADRVVPILVPVPTVPAPVVPGSASFSVILLLLTAAVTVPIFLKLVREP